MDLYRPSAFRSTDIEVLELSCIKLDLINYDNEALMLYTDTIFNNTIQRTGYGKLL